MIDDNGVDWEWCPTCRARREVVDRHTEYALESGYMRRSTTEVPYAVVDFRCGHSKSERSGEGTTFRDPDA